jgi:hypothetical protein
MVENNRIEEIREICSNMAEQVEKFEENLKKYCDTDHHFIDDELKDISMIISGLEEELTEGLY